MSSDVPIYLHTRSGRKTPESPSDDDTSDVDVRLIDHKALSSIYPAMKSSFFSSAMAVFDKGQPLVYTLIPSFIPNMIFLKGFHMHVLL